MIFGTITFSPGRNYHADRLLSSALSDEISTHQIETEGFSGGYCLNSLLPFRHDDVYCRDETGSITVMLSGTVYNTRELSQESGTQGNVQGPRLIASMFLREGPSFVRKLNGDFAIFILDWSHREAYLFRDHIGIRPMAWATSDDCLMFSSDVVGLCRSLKGSREADIDYLLGYLKYTDNTRTPDRRVRKLLPGQYLHFCGSETDVTRYWKPETIRIDRRLGHEEMLSDLDLLLRDAVRIRSDCRFTAGAHLSSGLDSALVSGLARRQYSHQERFYGYSWSPENFDPGTVKYDERKIIRKFGRQKKIIPVFTTLEPEGLRSIISNPEGNVPMFYEDRTLEQAVSLGTNLIFSGWGGDEFISTGDRGVEQDLLRNMSLRTFFRRNPLKPFGKFVFNQLNYVIYPALGILERGITDSFRDDTRFLREQFRKSDRKAISTFYFHRSRREVHLNMLRFGHLQRRCEVWMINGFRKGVDYRYPLLDRRIIEYMLKVPSHLLCVTDTFRPLLRELGKGILPDEIRMNYSKTDPVSWAYTRILYRETALLLLGETEEWKKNPDLYFIDFDQFERATDGIEFSSDRKDDVSLFRSIVTIKYLHEFTRSFRSN